jgi:uncharacterized protein YkuJ
MDEAEREEFERTGEIWVGVMALTTAPTQPPISLMTFNPFEHYGFDSLDLSDDFKIETD